MTIRQSLVLLAGLCACSPLLNAQELKHAPTAEQCQADQRLWLSELAHDAAKKPVSETHSTVWQWIYEMRDCHAVDPANYWLYYNTIGEAYNDLELREADFINRHGMRQQYIDEDAAGKR